MFLQWIRVENYRNLQEVTVQFHKQYNYFVGENAIGKSNLLDLLSILANTKGFDEKDFFEIHKPIRITMEIELEEAEQGTYWDEDDSTVNTITLVAEQLLQEVYPRLYRQTDTKRRPLPLALFRKICYVSHRDTSIASLYEIRQSTLAGLEKQLHQFLSSKGLPDSAEKSCQWLVGESISLSALTAPVDLCRGYVPAGISLMERLLTMLAYHERMSDCGYTPDTEQLLLVVQLKMLAYLYERSQSMAANLRESLVYVSGDRCYLPLLVSVDEPEIRLNPYLQRAVLSCYRKLLSNESSSFSALLKGLFGIDGLRGQLFIVTHATDALIDDYRNIIRFYRDTNGHIATACGASFFFPRELEKHLIMHFPEAKEALYARAIILVEGETEYGSFRGFGEHIGVDFDYYGICLINARGESSISKLAKLFRRFSIPTVVLYDQDVSEKYSRNSKNIFFTDTLCFEAEIVTHLLGRKRRDILDKIVADLVEDGHGTVTRDMLKRGLAKLSVQRTQISPRRLSHISDRQYKDLKEYYFSWFYSNKGVIVGRRIAYHLTDELIPPVFKAVICRARDLALHHEQKEDSHDRDEI